MKDLTQVFSKAISSEVNWPFSKCSAVIETLKQADVAVSFWEGEENWASILLNNELVGYIWSKHPVIVLDNKAAFEIKELLVQFSEIVYIEAASLNGDVFKMDRNKLNAHFDFFNDFESFTLEQLWFQTNSI